MIYGVRQKHGEARPYLWYPIDMFGCNNRLLTLHMNVKGVVKYSKENLVTNTTLRYTNNRDKKIENGNINFVEFLCSSGPQFLLL